MSLVDSNGDGDDSAVARKELDSLILALHAAREQTEVGEAVRWGEPVVRFVHAVAEREAEKYPPPLREQVEVAVVRGVAHALAATLRIYFSPVTP